MQYKVICKDIHLTGDDQQQTKTVMDEMIRDFPKYQAMAKITLSENRGAKSSMISATLTTKNKKVVAIDEDAPRAVAQAAAKFRNLMQNAEDQQRN